MKPTIAFSETGPSEQALKGPVCGTPDSHTRNAAASVDDQGDLRIRILNVHRFIAGDALYL
jgi:hypothetical protein